MSRLLIIFIIMGCILIVQLTRDQLFSATTFFVGYYICFYVLAPIINGREFETASIVALKGAVTFALAWFFFLLLNCRTISVVRTRTGKVDYADTRGLELEGDKKSRNRKKCTLLLALTVLFLLMDIGVGGAIAVLQGTISSISIMRNGGILFSIFNYLRLWWGYMIVLVLIQEGRKLNKFLLYHLLLFCVITVVFSFTRSSAVYVIGMVAVVLLIDKERKMQIMYFSGVVLACVIIMFGMGVIRTWGLRKGISAININFFKNVMDSSFDFTIVYKAFAELVDTDVRITPLVYLKVLFVIVPRQLWENKPYASSIEILRKLHWGAWKSGYSTGYSLLGEAQAIWGKCGVYVYSIVYAFFSSIVDAKVKKQNKCGFRDDFPLFLCVYYFLAFLIDASRQGTDIAIMNCLFYLLPIYYMNKYKLVIGNKFKV